MSQVIVSAPGKIHLLGEHVVVYGKPALLSAIDKRLYVRIQNSEFRIQNDNEVIIKSSAGDRLVKEAVSVFKRAYSIGKLPPVKLTITSQIPEGAGLGSSAAVSAAIIGAMMKYVKNLWNPARINELAFEVEKMAHGNPSGADNTTVVFGGLVWFRRELDFLKSIWSLPIANYKIPRLVMVNTGKPEETTKEMVSLVNKRWQRNKKEMEAVFSNQEKQTKKLLLALKTGNRKKMSQAIKTGERNLEKIGVVSDFAKKIIREIFKKGGVAKICGAGGRKEGSGILLCFHQDLQKIAYVAKKYNLPVSPIKLGEEGIRIEKKQPDNNQ